MRVPFTVAPPELFDLLKKIMIQADGRTQVYLKMDPESECIQVRILPLVDTSKPPEGQDFDYFYLKVLREA